jgi:hypothetical protein
MTGPTRRRRAGRRLTAAALALLLCGAASARAGELSDPAQTLRYRVAWNGLTAARATVNIQPEELAGEAAYTVETSARTNSFIDLFYPFRGTARVVFLAREHTPLRFVYDREIRGEHSLTTVDFRPYDQRVHSLYVKGGVTKKRLDLANLDFLDPITAVFKARSGSRAIGTRADFDIFTGESRYRVELTVDGRDHVEVPAGRFAALRVTPKVWKIRGDQQPPDPRLRGATIWVTDDEHRVLLRIRSDIFIGAVTLDLLSREVAS